ncbi:hypothetical protein ABT160_07540 [Streptomyces sp. NPDC001941]|uniref:hypothetical protein n=1 Tax=Streptomyces sp. NPDC001941 TaxID=3154659 RepID=UPI003328235E
MSIVVDQDGVEDVVTRARLEVRTGAAWAAWEVATAAHADLAAPVAARQERGGVQGGLGERVLPVVWACVAPGERPGYPAVLETFLVRHEERLKRLFSQYGTGSAGAVDAEPGRCELYASPVSLMVLERLTGSGSRVRLAGHWKNEDLDQSWLKDAATAWDVTP